MVNNTNVYDSETIRKLWEKPNLGMKERVLEMYKSSMDNMFFNEDENMNSSLKSFDHDLNLQKLVSSIIELNHKLPKKEEEEEEATKQTSSDAIASESTVPHRRLYSDVVQGNRSNLKSQKQCSEPLSPKSDAWSDDTCTTSARSCSQSCASSVKNFQITASCTDYNEGIPIPGGTEADLNRMAPNLESSPTSPEQPEQLQTVSSKSTSMKYTYSDAVNSSCGYSVNQYNLPFLNDISAFDTAARTSSSSTNFQNVFNPLVTNTMYSANYRVSTFPAPTTNYTTNANFVNPQLQLNRPPMATSSASNQCQQLPQAQQPWIVTQYRPTPYSVLLLPQLPTKHRWTNPHFVRPPTPPSTNIYTANASGAQTWPLQSANRTTNAAQAAASMQPSSFTLYETLKKSTKVSTSTNAATTVPSSAMTANLTKFSRSRTPEPTSKITQQPFAKPRSQLVRPQKLSSSVFRVPTKQEKEFLPTRVQGTVSCRIGGHCLDDQVIPINCSASDDLEKIALLEYHSSNDIFFSEIERQAKEQYDGNPENYCRPPSKGHLLAGGLLYLTFYTIRI